MLTAIAIAEAVAATGTAMFAIWRWKVNLRHLRIVERRLAGRDAKVGSLESEVEELNAEVEARVANATELSARLDEIERRRRQKPGAATRAALRAQVAARAAELRGEVIA